MFKKSLAVFFLSLVLVSFSVPVPVSAIEQASQGIVPGVGGVITNPLTGVNSLADLLDKVLSALIQIGIPVIVIAYIWAGFKYVTAFGDASAVTKATEIFKWTTVGAGVLLGSKTLSLLLQGTLNSVGLQTSLLHDSGAFLAQVGSVTTFAGLVQRVLAVLGSIVPVIFALAMIYFLWGVLEYVTKAGEDKQEATEKIVGGLVALAVMFSVYGLVRVVQGTFPLDARKIESVQL